MADSSLDDFFAKKDKSKKKSKSSKFTPSDILAQDGENTTEKPAKKSGGKKKKDKDKSNQSNKPGGSKAKEEDEWQDFQSDEEKDFSDLKIANLQVGAREDDGEGDKGGEGSGTEDGDGENRDKRDGTSGPWNKAGQTNTEEEAAPEPAPEPTPAPVEAPKTTGKYIPPSLRRQMESGGGGAASPSQAPLRRGRPKQAPDVSSEFDFPTLGGGPAGGALNTPSGRPAAPAAFETVRGGGRQMADPSLQSSKVAVGNKFDALSDDA